MIQIQKLLQLLSAIKEVLKFNLYVLWEYLELLACINEDLNYMRKHVER